MKIVEDNARRARESGAESYGIGQVPTMRHAAETGPDHARRRRRGTGRLATLATALWIGLAGAALGGCSTTPITGSKSLILFPKSYDVQLGLQAVDQYVDQSKVIESGPDAAMVERVMQKLVAAAGEDGEPYEWSVRLVDEPETVNAFALPGGPMAVYTGILPVTQTEAGLAVVMGHELGHVLARHGMQRMTRSAGASAVLNLFEQSEWTELASMGYQFAVELPFGRGDESESDHLGLILMARAGYDPREAPLFWKRMSELSGGGSGPEWLSTHPSHETRQQDLEALMPEALEAYQKATGTEPDGLKQYDGR